MAWSRWTACHAQANGTQLNAVGLAVSLRRLWGRQGLELDRLIKSRSRARTTGHYGTRSALISRLGRRWVVSIVRVGVPWFSPALTRFHPPSGVMHAQIGVSPFAA